jgi:hypothetical protein
MAAGARRLRLVGIVWAYVYSGAWFGFCLGALVIGSAVQVIDPDVLDRVLVGLREAMATGTDVGPTWRPTLRRCTESRSPGRRLVLMLLGLALWVATVFWSIVAWGALRQTLGSTRAQAAAATGLWLAMLLGVIWAARGLG